MLLESNDAVHAGQADGLSMAGFMGVDEHQLHVVEPEDMLFEASQSLAPWHCEGSFHYRVGSSDTPA
ncbi:hypothetical protein ELY33_02850 [Vreelandella andesensis]|uniref:Uncharacterized protein n=1 Tax=Vreelandella andesensis TaxID=447567 RepID=A0A433KUR2_9GAMM|nr:hypothetical protein [Halomonas andesensis]RUR33314.1 hypothetical protein ELY33_02850 [Halomonas andesensis]